MAGINDTLLDRFVGHRVNLMRVEEGLRPKVLGLLKTLERDLANELAKANLTGTATRFRVRRTEALLKQVRGTIRTAHVNINTVMTKELLNLADIEAATQVNLMNSVFQAPVTSIANTRNVLTAVVKTQPTLGAPLKDWWSKQGVNLRHNFDQQVRMGVIAGETNQQLVRRLRGAATGKKITVEIAGKSVRVNEFAGGLMQTSTREATALVRTAVQNTSNQVAQEVYKENQDLLKGQQAVATLDRRTTDICMSRDGGMWDMEGNALPESAVGGDFPGAPPWHVQCRTFMVPVTKSWEELIREQTGKTRKIKEIPTDVRASMDGLVPAKLNYEQWLRTKPAAFQLDKLGPGRYKLWKEGKLPFNKLVSQEGRPLTLKQLKSLGGTPPTGTPKLPPPPPPPAAPPAPKPKPKPTPFPPLAPKGPTVAKSSTTGSRPLTDSQFRERIKNNGLTTHSLPNVGTMHPEMRGELAMVFDDMAQIMPKDAFQFMHKVNNTNLTFDNANVMAHVRSFGGRLNDGKKVGVFNHLEFHGKWWSQDRSMGTLRYAAQNSQDVKFLVGGTPRSLMIHELGHVVDFNRTKAMMEWTKPLRDFIKQFPPTAGKTTTRFLGDYAMYTNWETFAESFVVAMGEGSANSKYQRALFDATKMMRVPHTASAATKRKVAAQVKEHMARLTKEANKGVEDRLNAARKAVADRKLREAAERKVAQQAAKRKAQEALERKHAAEKAARDKAAAERKHKALLVKRAAEQKARDAARKLADQKLREEKAARELAEARAKDAAETARKQAALKVAKRKAAEAKALAEKELAEDIARRKAGAAFTRPKGGPKLAPSNMYDETLQIRMDRLAYRPEFKHLSQPELRAMIKDIDDGMTKLITSEKTQVWSRINGNALKSVLDDGRFLTQHEVSDSMGMYNPKMRKAFEQGFFGVAKNTQAKRMPFYGYLDDTPMGRSHSDALYGYGDIRVKFKPGVKARSTFVEGDSLESATSFVDWRTDKLLSKPLKSYKLPSYANDPHPASWGGLNRAPSSINKIPTEYMEAQMHGGVAVGDIESIVIQASDAHHYKAVIQKAKNRGITVILDEGEAVSKF